MSAHNFLVCEAMIVVIGLAAVAAVNIIAGIAQFANRQAYSRKLTRLQRARELVS
jgi:integral membrane sensor domain MASE1